MSNQKDTSRIQTNVKRLEAEIKAMQDYQKFCNGIGLISYGDSDIARESHLRQKLIDLKLLLPDATDKA